MANAFARGEGGFTEWPDEDNKSHSFFKCRHGRKACNYWNILEASVAGHPL